MQLIVKFLVELILIVKLVMHGILKMKLPDGESYVGYYIGKNHIGKKI